MARCLLFEKNLPKTLWAEIVSTAMYLQNRLPTKALAHKTPFKAWFGFKPSLAHLKVFGCVCYAHTPAVKRDKLLKRAQPGILVGYSLVKKAIVEPSSFEEAEANEGWKQAMVDEIKMIQKNQTWELVEKPVNRKTIGVKWVYQAKQNVDGSLNKLKARLVVKGFSQRYGLDYMETFAPVARLDTIRFLVALAAQKQWIIHQLDVKSAFLNGFLEEEIYINQPQGGDQIMLANFKAKMKDMFEMSDLGQMTYFLGMEKLRRLPVISNCNKTGHYVCCLCAFKVHALQKYATSLSSKKSAQDDMKSTSGYAFTLGSAMFCWSSRKQSMVAQSTAEAEYVSAASAVNQDIWLKKILADLNLHQREATEIYCDNKSTVAIAKNLVFHGRTKQFSIKLHVVREMEQAREVELIHCNSEEQAADIITKALSVQAHTAKE
ncbi:hypothetical protein CXB51_005648 [Gossypium anomalum]|uniref:Reverse transcriptase Ty1/copia-type domain-containing protein n=1 Tax=Gossypium anomalum TaxID=47600 RepID=A0A8J5ZCL1_9ROSI|nr:hypothetical protein CXB51_005648 [Gossypium anomalum]